MHRGVPRGDLNQILAASGIDLETPAGPGDVGEEPEADSHRLGPAGVVGDHLDVGSETSLQRLRDVLARSGDLVEMVGIDDPFDGESVQK